MPTPAAQSLLRPGDITKGNVQGIAVALAVLLRRRLLLGDEVVAVQNSGHLERL